MKITETTSTANLQLALEPRMMFDAAAAATAADVAVQADTGAAPDVDATAKTATVTIDKNGTPSGAADLFDGVTVKDSGVAEGEYAALEVTVDTYGEGQVLTVNGTDIKLTAGSGKIVGTDYTYSVTLENGKAVIKLGFDQADDPVKAADIAKLIDGMAYKVTDGINATVGTVTVSITGLYEVDSNNGDSSATIDGHFSDLNATLTIESQYNYAPTLDNTDGMHLADQISLAGIDKVSEIHYADNGNLAFAADADGNISVIKIVDGKLTTIASITKDQITAAITNSDHNFNDFVDMVVSKDGKNAYLLSETTIVVLGFDGDSLTVKESFRDSSLTWDGKYGSYLEHAKTITSSADGKTIFVGSGNGLFYFNVNDDGTLISQDNNRLHDTAFKDGYPMVARGDFLFTAQPQGLGQNNSLTIYQRQSDGSWKELSKTMFEGDISGWDTQFKLTVSDDGKTGVLLVIDMDRDHDDDWNDILVPSGEYESFVFTFDGEKVNQGFELGIKDVTDMVMSTKGEALFVLTQDGTITKYSLGADGSLTTVASRSGFSGAGSLSVDAAGNLLIGGDVVSLIAGATTGVWGNNVEFTDNLVMADKNLDAKADGKGDYTGAGFTVKASDTAGEFEFSKEGWIFSDNTLSKDGKVLAEITRNTAGELTLVFKNGCTTQEANEVLQGWSFRTSNPTASSVSLTVTVTDGEKTSDSVTLDIALHANRAPSVTGEGVDNKTFDTAGEEFGLFDKVLINAGDSDQTVKQVTISIDGLENVSSDEYLLIDGTKLNLSRSGSVTTASGLTLTLTIVDGKGTLTISGLQTMATMEVSALLSSMKYGNTSETEMKGSHTFSIVSVTDNGGTLNGGTDTASVDGISATIEVAVNNAPTVDIDSDSTSGLFYNDGQVAGMESDRVISVIETNGGKTILVIGNTNTNGRGDSFLRVYSRDTTTGVLSLVQSFAQGGEYAGLFDMTTMKMGLNGDIYVAGSVVDDSQNCAIVRFVVDSETGRLTYKGVVAQQGVNGVSGLNGTISDIEFSVDGKTLYTVNGLNVTKTTDSKIGSSLTAFCINEDGSLTFLAEYTGTDQGINIPGAMAFSPDGKYIYVANKNSLSIFERNNDGTLELTKTVTVGDIFGLEETGYFSELTDVEVSSDGKFVFVRGGTNATYNVINVFERSGDGTLSFVETFNVASHGSSLYARGEMTLSADGTSLVITSFGSNAVLICAIDRNTGHLTLSDTVKANTACTNFVLTSDGHHFYGGGYAWWGGLYELQSMSKIIHTTTGELSLAGLSVSDRDANARAEGGNYGNVSVTIERNGGKNASDVFTFTEADGYAMADGEITLNGKVIAKVTNADGAIQLTFVDGVTKEAANGAVKHINYLVTDSTESKVQMKVTVNDGDGKETSALFAIVEAPAFEINDVLTTPTVYPNDSVTFLDNVTIRQNDKDAVMDGAVLTVVSSDTGAIFGANGDYSLSADGKVMKGDTEIGSYTTANGKLTVTFNSDTGTIDDVNAFLKSLTYKTDNVQDGASVTFGVSFHDKSGDKSASETDVSTVYFNKPPEFNDAYKNWTPDTSVIDTDYELKLPEDLFTDDLDKTLTIDVSGLPEGLTYKDGVISGSVTESGTYTITVKATDSMNRTTTEDFTFTVRDNTAPEVNPSYTLPAGSISSGFDADLSQAFTDKEGDAFTVKITSELPAGLTFDAATGKLSGAPLYPGDYTIELTATDKYGKTSEKLTLTLTVADMDVVILPDAADSTERLTSDRAEDGEMYSEPMPENAGTVAGLNSQTGDRAAWDGSSGADTLLNHRLEELFGTLQTSFDLDRDVALSEKPVKAVPQEQGAVQPVVVPSGETVPAEATEGNTPDNGDVSSEKPASDEPKEAAPEGKLSLTETFRRASLYETFNEAA